MMFQVCEDGQLSGAGLQCGYHSAGRVRLHIGLRGVGKLQVRQAPIEKLASFTFKSFSVAGFEMVLQRHVSHYLITYYLPSGKHKYRYQDTNIDI